MVVREPTLEFARPCTDFSFGLGLNSLELFAEDLVVQCYGHERVPRQGSLPFSSEACIGTAARQPPFGVCWLGGVVMIRSFVRRGCH